MLIDPDLDASWLVGRRLQQVNENGLIGPQDVAGEAQPVDAGNRERNVDRF